MNNLICDKLKGIVNLQDIIKADKVYNFSKYSLPLEIYRKEIYH